MLWNFIKDEASFPKMCPIEGINNAFFVTRIYVSNEIGSSKHIASSPISTMSIAGRSFEKGVMFANVPLQAMIVVSFPATTILNK